MFHVKHELEEIKNCPLCGGDKVLSYIKCVDHNFSGEVFNIDSCVSCNFKFTNPRPSEKKVHKYYQSDNYISHTSSKKGLFNTIYHTVRNYQFKKKYSIINSLTTKDEKTILDVGCGTGEFLNYFKQKNWLTKGVETDKKAREHAIEKYNCSVDDKIDKIIKSGEKFDIITLWHVLEHVYDFKDYLYKLKGVLNKGGHIILGLPNCNSYDANYYKENWYAFDLPIHVSHFTQNDIKALVKEIGFSSLTTKPLIFDAYYISMLSSKKSSSNYIKGIYKGWLSNREAKKNQEYSSLIYIIRL